MACSLSSAPLASFDKSITEEALRAKGKKFDVLYASTREEIDAAFAALPELKIGALLLIPDLFFNYQTATSDVLNREILHATWCEQNQMQLRPSSTRSYRRLERRHPRYRLLL